MSWHHGRKAKCSATKASFNAWMVDKSDPKYKNRDKKAEKWEEITAILGEEGK